MCTFALLVVAVISYYMLVKYLTQPSFAPESCFCTLKQNKRYLRKSPRTLLTTNGDTRHKLPSFFPANIKLQKKVSRDCQVAMSLPS